MREAPLDTWYHAVLQRAALVLFGVCFAAQCSPSPAARQPHTRALAASPKPARTVWAPLAEVESWPVLNAQPFVTRGHLVTPSYVEVRINPEARDQYLELVTDSQFDDGTILALFFTDEPREQQGPVYAMHKVRGDWRFVVTDRAGGIDPSADDGACRRCHEGAPASGVFGLPRQVTGAASPPARAEAEHSDADVAQP